MAQENKWTENAAGRMIPPEINGETVIPYQGVGKYKPAGHKHAPPIPSCTDYPADGNK